MTIDTGRAIDDAHRVVRQLELAVTRRLDGLLQGDHLGINRGPGSEPDDGRRYQPGDDVRRIDWNLSARSNEIQVRDTAPDRELETWVIVDGSASLDFGTDQWHKRDLAIAATATFGFLSCMSGSRFGSVVVTPEGSKIHPAASGRDNVRRALLELQRRGPAREGGVDLATAIERVGRASRRPGVVALVSDLMDDGAWARPMRALAAASRTIVAEIRDPREDQLAPVGLLTLVDPENGRVREVQTNDPTLRARFAEAATRRRAECRRRAHTSGAEHLLLTTDNDWLVDIARHHRTAAHFTQRRPR
jgi:uncharacterized protein (DUF58 family)